MRNDRSVNDISDLGANRYPHLKITSEAFPRVLAAGTLTGYSSAGQPRHLMPYISWILDQCDR